MTLIFCLDDKNGMMFNKRRQSRDRVIYKRILENNHFKRLLMSSYSYELFKNINNDKVNVSDDFLKLAEENDACFVENGDYEPYLYKADKVIIYRFNRVYPSDKKFKADLEKLGFLKKSSEDFEGYSHEKLTEEVYSK